MDEYEDKLNWHEAFQDAVKMEFAAYKEVLEFEFEEQLTVQALQIDAVIIKKRPEVKLELNIGRIFKGVNVIEYKSPDDYFSIKDYYKVFGYVYLYLNLNKDAELSDITLTIVESRHPKALLDFLRGRGLKVEERGAGITAVLGEAFPVQIVEMKKLSSSENKWFSELRTDLSLEDAERVSEQFTDKENITFASAFYSVVAKANSKIFMEVWKMKYPTMEEMFEKSGLTKIWETRGEEKILSLFKQGYTVDQVEKIMLDKKSSRKGSTSGNKSV
jgi:hypothetical protein